MAHDRVEAVERALTVLAAFDPEVRALSLAELAAATGFYKSTILRLARSLERFGFLIRAPDGSFRLGPELWRLGSLYRRDHDLGEYVRPALRRLRDQSAESASFYIRDGDRRVCLYRIDSTREIRHHLDEGTQLPLDRGAAGHVLLALGGEPGDRYDRIRRRGYDISLGERDPDVAAVAVAVVTADRTLRGALALSGLRSHFDKAFRKKCVGWLIAAATDLSASLSHLSP
ncbi:MAG: helix-turn-helix domain-containing protein [Alphaproteobacteria bacterium]